MKYTQGQSVQKIVEGGDSLWIYTDDTATVVVTPENVSANAVTTTVDRTDGVVKYGPYYKPTVINVTATSLDADVRNYEFIANPTTEGEFGEVMAATGGMTPSEIGGALKRAAKHTGVVVTELGLSLLDQGRSPSYQAALNAGDDPTLMRKYDQKGVFSWLKRQTQNGFTYLQTAGKSGDTNEGALARLQTDVLGQTIKPDYCHIWTGGNDINGITSYEQAETEIAAMISDFEQIINILSANGIEIIMSVLPYNGSWVRNQYAMWAQSEWMQYCIEQGRKGRFAAFLNFSTVLVDPEAAWPKENVPLSRSANVVTATWAGHGFKTGDRVLVDAVDISFENNGQPLGFLITVVNATLFTYENTGINSSTTATVVKVNIEQNLPSDGTTHFKPAAASKACAIALEPIKTLFPPRDILSSSENDYKNLVGCGKNTTQFRPNLGMMYGTGGTKSGTPLPTGDVARSHEVKVVNGNPTSVTCSIIQDPTVAHSQFLWQQIAIVAGASDCEISFEIAHTKPSTWMPLAPVTPGKVVIPTVENGFFYAALNTSNGTNGDTEPVWPTRLGETVVSGDVTYSCRLGYIEGVTKCYAASAYKIISADTDAVHCISYGIIDNTTGADSILDFNNNQDDTVPFYRVGYEEHTCTPEAVLGATGSSFTIATKIRVAAGKSATVAIARETWRVV